MKTFAFILFLLLLPVLRLYSQPLVAITFDDGPNTSTTSQVLDKLEKYNIVASFFLIGDSINSESEDQVRRAFKMGCDIENHSKTHSHMKMFSPKQIKDEIKYTSKKIKEITGKSPKFFRPPYIDMSETMFKNIKQTFICGIGANDWMPEVNAEERAKRIVDNVKDGNVILLHDFVGNNATVDALDIIIPTLQKKGFEFVTISQLFKRSKISPKRGVIYSNVYTE